MVWKQKQNPENKEIRKLFKGNLWTFGCNIKACELALDKEAIQTKTGDLEYLVNSNFKKPALPEMFWSKVDPFILGKDKNLPPDCVPINTSVTRMTWMCFFSWTYGIVN